MARRQSRRDENSPVRLNYQRISLRPDEAQYIESRKFGVIEVARIFNVPPIMIQAEEAASYQAVPRMICFSQNTPLRRGCVSRTGNSREAVHDSRTFDAFVRVRFARLMRGDLAARSAYYSQMISAGVLSIDEVRREENRDRSRAVLADTIWCKSTN